MAQNPFQALADPKLNALARSLEDYSWSGRWLDAAIDLTHHMAAMAADRRTLEHSRAGGLIGLSALAIPKGHQNLPGIARLIESLFDPQTSPAHPACLAAACRVVKVHANKFYLEDAQRLELVFQTAMAQRSDIISAEFYEDILPPIQEALSALRLRLLGITP